MQRWHIMKYYYENISNVHRRGHLLSKNIHWNLNAVSYTHLDVYKRQASNGLWGGSFEPGKDFEPTRKHTRNEFCCNTFHLQIFSQNSLAWTPGYSSHSLQFIDCSTTIKHDHNMDFFNVFIRFGSRGTSRSWSVFNWHLTTFKTVSYTHLDVYKRQPLDICISVSIKWRAHWGWKIFLEDVRYL